jgi:alpha-galactosidase
LYAETEGGRDGFSEGDGASIGGGKQSGVFREHPEWFTSLNLNLAISEAASYMESEISKMIELYKLDLYRHDQNGIVFFPPGPGSGQTLRDRRFTESNYWRHCEALYAWFGNIHAKYPDLILQQAAAGNFRLDLGTVGVFHEQFTSDRATVLYVYRMLSGMSVYLPPECLVNSNGMAWPKDQPDLDTTLRGAYTLTNTPMIFNFILPKSIEELRPEIRQKFLHYANIYKTFIRPLIATCKVYHLAPVNAPGGVESSDWFGMEFTSPDQQKGWATIIRLSKSTSENYLFKPKGLDGRRKYSVTFDNTAKTQLIDGEALMRDGLSIRLPPDSASELLLFEGR